MGPALDVLEAQLVATGRGTDAVHKMRSSVVVASPSQGRPGSTRPPMMRRDPRGHRERRP
jgi:hypothetical protein